MKSFTVGLLGAAVVGATMMTVPASARAGCDDSYMYMWASCTQDRMQRPEWGNDCEIDVDDEDGVRNVLFISNVFNDRDDGVRAGSVFFDRIESQHRVSMNGEESRCYSDFDEAVADRQEMVADRSRSDWLIRRVLMPRT